MNNLDQEEIITKRLLLRRFKREDAETIARLCNNYNLYEKTLLPHPYTLEDANDWLTYLEESWDPERVLNYAITDKQTGALYGSIEATISRFHKRAELGYWLGEEYWNRGIMTEALINFINYLFVKKNIHKVYGYYFAENISSGKVMEKAGLTYDGTLKDHILKNNQYKDLVLMSLINNF